MDTGFNTPSANLLVAGVQFNVPNGFARTASTNQLETVPKVAAQTNSGVPLKLTTADGNSRIVNPS